MHESRDRTQVLTQIIHEPIDSKGVKPLFYRVGGGGVHGICFNGYTWREVMT